MKLGAWKAQAVADTAEQRKLADLAIKVGSLPNNSQPNECCLGWEFVPLAFDSLGTPSTTISNVVEEHAKQVAMRSGCSYWPRETANLPATKLRHLLFKHCGDLVLRLAVR